MGARESRFRGLSTTEEPTTKQEILSSDVTEDKNSRTTKLCLNLRNRKNCQVNYSKTSNVYTESPVNIRRQQLRDLQDARPQLTDKQMELILATWKVLQLHIAELGSDIFIRLFDRYPDMKDAFGPFRSIRPEDAHYKRVLEDHGKRVLGTLQMVIDYRHDPEHVVNELNQLGQKHVTFNAKSDYMDIVSQMFMFAIEPVLAESWTPDVETAWAQMFRYIVHLMREAMIL